MGSMKNEILAIVVALAVIGIAHMSVLGTDIQKVSMKANNTSCIGQDMQGGSWLLLQPEGAVAQIDVTPEKILDAQFQAASVEKHGDNYLVTVPGNLDPKLTDDLGYPGAKMVERNNTTEVTIVAAPESVITNYLKKNLDADVNVVDIGPVKYEIRTNVTRESLNAILAPVGGNVPVGAETFFEGVTAETLDETKKILGSKLYHLGLKDVKIRVVGSQYLLIDTPGMDVATAEEVVAKQGKFEIRIQTHDNETEHMIYGDSVESLETPQGDRQGVWGVPFTLSEEGAKIFQKAAIDAGAIKNPDAHTIFMYLDEDEIFNAPLSAELADSLEKTPLRTLEAMVGSGDAASQKAKELYLYLRVGALPVNVSVIERGCL